MTKTLTATEARKGFFGMLKTVETPGVSITITYEGHPKGVLMSFDEFEGLMETLDILSNPDEVAAIQLAMIEKEKGDVVSFEEFQKSLAL